MTADIVKKHVSDKNIISVLQSIQGKYGYIPEKETQVIARELGIPLAKMFGVITFYSQFKLKKSGKYVISICNGTACHVNRSADIIESLKQHLKVELGDTTDDGLFTLECVNCIGACARAPAIMINGKVYGDLDSKKVIKVIEGYKK
ncbi:MAG: NADH-quinone oxidoreductase subunit NuoE [Candidatus Woesearchaeota archaeon]